MRNAMFLAAVAVFLLLTAGALSRIGHPVTAAHSAAAAAHDVYAIEKSLDLGRLPRIEPPTEAEE